MSCYGRRWAEASRKFLLENPICAKCPAPAKHVDHIKPWQRSGKRDLDLFWSKRNWQPLCVSCHSKKTRADDVRPLKHDEHGRPLDPNHPWNKRR